MLTPTIDAVARWLNSRAALPLLVKIEVALALGCASINRKAASRSLTGHTDATGPKISSRPIAMAGFTSSNTDGPMKKPSGRSGTRVSRPSSARRAPSLTPFST